MKDFAEHILDITQNSLRANASQIQISIFESKQNNVYQIKISDNGSGMDAETLSKVTDPFFTSRTTRKVGLGIPLFKQNAELTGGSLSLVSEPGKGTSINANFILNHFDRLPPGDIAGSVVLLISANPSTDFEFLYRTDLGEFELKTTDIKEQLGTIPITEPSVRKFIKELILENLKEIGAEL